MSLIKSKKKRLFASKKHMKNIFKIGEGGSNRTLPAFLKNGSTLDLNVNLCCLSRDCQQKICFNFERFQFVIKLLRATFHFVFAISN